MPKKCIVMILFSLWLTTNAQDTWTLKQCIDYGLKNNRNKIIYANEKLVADAMAKEALADFLPRINVTAALENNLKVQQSIIPAGVLGPEETRISFNQKFNSDAMAQVDQLIYDQSLLTGLQANKYNQMRADLKVEQSQETIIFNISTAYFLMLVYREQLDMLRYNKSTYEKQLDIYRLQVSKGTALQKDLDKVDVEYNNTLSNIGVAQSNLRLSENALRYEMGYLVNGSLKISLSNEVKLPPKQLPDTGLFSPALRTDYQLGELNVKLLAIEQSLIKAEAMPKLSAYFRYGAVGFGNNLKGVYRELYPYSTLGLKLNIPILDFYKRNARYRQATLKRINAEESLKLSEGKYSIEYENARTKLLQAAVSVENDKRNIALAESVLKVTDLQLQKGITDLTDWLSTQHALKEAQNSYLNDLFSYYQARVDLEKAEGSLKTFYQSL
jgi:outer membrane protein